jgi:dihydrodipicolinate synthase/N-acetylneuraminate lyase
MKAMMNLSGQADGPVRPPLPNLRPGERDEIKSLLERWRPFLS